MSTNTGSMQTQLFQLYQNLGGVVLPDQNSNSYSTQGWLAQINLSLEGNVSNWNTAYGWGDHAAAGYLDEYEEGTWTPVFGGFGGSESGQSYSNQLGWYTKIGNLVTFGCFISISTVGTITGAYLVIKGLPFTIGNNIYGGVSVAYYNGLNINVYSVSSWLGNNSTQLFLGKSSGAADSTDLSIPSDIKNNSTMYLAGSYQV